MLSGDIIMQRLFFVNYLLVIPLIAWAIAQLIKTVLHVAFNRKFSVERLVGAGGWPSSHSALVCAMFLGAAKKYGLESPIFAIAFILAAIVMYDAMGVRRETGEQAKVINKIIEDMKNDNKELDFSRPLKELVGHTPFQVLSGALLGILVAIVIPVF